MLDLEELLLPQQQKKLREIELYKTVLLNIENKIKMYNNLGHISCEYEIPSFIFGFPPINVPRTMEYVLGVLNKKGFIAFRTSPYSNTIYISWELTSVLKKKLKEEKLQEKTELEIIEENRNKDLDDILLSSRFKK